MDDDNKHIGANNEIQIWKVLRHVIIRSTTNTHTSVSPAMVLHEMRDWQTNTIVGYWVEVGDSLLEIAEAWLTLNVIDALLFLIRSCRI